MIVALGLLVAACEAASASDPSSTPTPLPYLTGPIGKDDCVVVFKETRGLMLKLHLERVIIVWEAWPDGRIKTKSA